MTFLLVLLVLFHVLKVHGYIPALPSNTTFQTPGWATTTGLHLQWVSNRSDWAYVTPQSADSKTNNVPVQGVLVHFTEDSAGNETTTTPWIAFVSCDANSTNPSFEADIFALAKDRGAKLAVMYSLYSETCVINPDYQGSALSVFTTQTLDASWRIKHEFGQFALSGGAAHGYFNATTLNDAARAVTDTIAAIYPGVPGFLFATLLAHNPTVVGIRRDQNATGTPTNTGSGDSQSTGVAMVVLYTITGCVSALFSAVIISGAIRTIRYPERYGPRSADPTLGGGQSRARGLGRAILDTFPVVKFGSSGNDRELAHPKDVESATGSSVPVPLPDSLQLAQFGAVMGHGEHHDPRAPTAGREAREDNQASEGIIQVDPPPRTYTADPGPSRASPPFRGIETGMPESIGRETCPICIVDFEEGDDLRVLPCEGKHRFHQSCVDPWLLELSGSCPICRQDFHALERIISGRVESDGINRHSEGGTSPTQNRFSRYLRFTRRRQGRPLSSEQMSPPPPES